MSIERVETKSITIRWIVNGFVAGAATIDRGKIIGYWVAMGNMETDWQSLFEFNKAIEAELKAQDAQG